MSADMLAHYSAALDEIYRLRQLLAYEARVVEATLDYKSFPKSRRAAHEAQVERMRFAARGNAEDEVGNLSHLSLRACMREAGMPDTLTRSQWEAR